MAADFDVPDSPYQPGVGFKFLKHSFGKKSVAHRSFQHSWGVKWPFLHYTETNDAVYCHSRLKMFKEKKAETTTKLPSGVWFPFLPHLLRPDQSYMPCSTPVIHSVP